MSMIDWEARFPELRPIESVPILWSAKGCGFVFYGRRDDDDETQSYVQTYGFCLFGIPLLNLGAYRFAEFPYGKDVVGRVPLSQPARRGQRPGDVMCVAGGHGPAHLSWRLGADPGAADNCAMPDLARFSTIGKPDEFARQRLARADELAAAGKAAEAARLCREVAQLPGSPPDRAAAAVQRVRDLLEHPAAPGAASEQAGVFQVAVALQQAGRWSDPPEALYRQGIGEVSQRGSADPAGRSRSSRPLYHWPRRARM